jgi:hypothetical protein
MVDRMPHPSLRVLRFRRTPPLALVALAATAAALASCSGDDDDEDPPFGMVLTTGQELDAWAREPAPARVIVTARVAAPNTPGESLITLVDQAWPFDRLSTNGLAFGAYALVSAEVRDASDKVLMRGETPVFQVNEGFGRELPLLVGRVNEFARPEGRLAGAWPNPKPILLDGRYIFLSGGDGTGTGGGAELFDLVRLAPLTTSAKLPRSPATVMTSDGQKALLINSEGATSYDFVAASSSEVALPAGAAAALAGGEAVLSDADTAEAFVVGATRAGTPSKAVLRISKSGLSVIELGVARERASAVWVKGRGLVVVGGAEGAPVELLAPKGESFTNQLVQAPTVFEPSLVPTASGDLLLAGGVDAAGAPTPPQRLSLACTAACPAAPEAVALPPLRAGRAFDVSTGTLRLVVGADADGFASAHLVDAGAAVATATPVPTRVQRRNGTALEVGGGYVALIGGTDAAGAPVQDVEVFTPSR